MECPFPDAYKANHTHRVRPKDTQSWLPVGHLKEIREQGGSVRVSYVCDLWEVEESKKVIQTKFKAEVKDRSKQGAFPAIIDIELIPFIGQTVWVTVNKCEE